MSSWTHVAGIIRIDSFRPFNDEPNWDRIFGKEITYEELMDWGCEKNRKIKKHPEDFLPFGTEGSLTKTIWTNPDESCMNAYTVSIFGDLRDYDTPEEIINWFKDKCLKLNVRNAVIAAYANCNKPLIWTYEN